MSAVTNAFGDPTRREIYLFVRDAGDQRASPRARSPSGSPSTPTSPATTSRSSRAAATSSSRSGARPTTVSARAAGRPSKRYRAGPLDATLALPLKHDDLLAGLLATALDALGPERGRARSPTRSASSTGDSSRRGWTRPRATARCAPRSARSPTRSPRTGSPRTPKRAAGSLAHRVGVLPVRRDRAALPARRVRARPRDDPRDARRPLRRDVAPVRGEPARRRRPLRRARLTRRGPRVPRPRVVVTAAPGRARGDAPVPPRPPRRPRAAPRTKAASRGSRSRTPASRSRRSSAHGRAKSCSPSSGTEAVNTAVWGAVDARGPDGRGTHVVTTAVEHSAVLDACAPGIRRRT